jgi:hypothetical protein
MTRRGTEVTSVLRRLAFLRVLVASISAVGVTSGVAASGATAAPGRASLVLELTRTTQGPSSFELTLVLAHNARGGEGLVASVGGHGSRGRYTAVVPGFVSSVARSDNRTASIDGRQVRVCDATSALCFNQTSVNGLFISSTSYSDSGAAGNLTTWFAVAEGASVRYEFSGRGWQVRRIKVPYRFVDGSDDQVAVHAGVQDGVEVFHRPVTLPGGRFGSLAVAAPPCSAVSVGIPRGVARLTLDGGESSVVAVCPSAASNPNKAAWAPSSTSWTLSGYAVGETSLAETRSFVLDLLPPRRHP